MKEKKESRSAKIFGIFLFISLILSVIFSFVRFLTAPEALGADQPYQKVKSDYLLMVIQCILGLVVMLLPTVISRKWKIVVPNAVCVLYFVFLYCSIFLGEVFMFYYYIPHWDTMLHAFSGAMLGALGFVLVDILNKDSHVKIQLSPFFVSFFAFCFALASGAVWEIYEYSFDWLLNLNMQKHRDEFGVMLIGRAALDDTMKDLIIDAVSAFAIAVVGYLTNLKKTKEKDTEEVR